MSSESSLNNKDKETSRYSIFPGELTGNIDGLKALRYKGPDPWAYVVFAILVFIFIQIVNGNIVLFT